MDQQRRSRVGLLLVAKVAIGRWQKEYNTIRPHSSLGNCPPAPEAVWVQPKSSGAMPLRLSAGMKSDSLSLGRNTRAGGRTTQQQEG